MSLLSRVLVVAVVALGLAAPSAAAVPDKKLGDSLGAMWKKVLETPTPQNPFAGGGPLCVDLGGVVAPVGAPGSESITCTVKPGTKVFVAAWSAECGASRVLPSLAAMKPSCGRVLAPSTPESPP